MAETPTPEAKRPRRWVQVLLVCSLALNLLIIGAVAGMVLSGGKWGPRHPPHMSPIGGPLTRALDQEDRRAIGAKMRAALADKPAQRGARRAQAEALLTALSAVPFDPDAVRTQLQALQSTRMEVQDLGRDMLVERLTEMTDADRAAYADRLRRAMRQMR